MIAIVKYNAGNITSVQNALLRLGAENIITDDPAEIKAAEKVIFPGVGEANSAMNYLRARNLDWLLKNLNQPVLGICLGLQLMCRHSEENDTTCLGIFDTSVRLFPPKEKVPHIGWNEVANKQSILLKGFQMPPDVYFVHSYYAEVCAATVGMGNYILPFSAVLEKDNFYATQFHPEKSGAVGEQILHNFLNI